MDCLCGLLKVRPWMALNFLKWNSNTTEEDLFKVAVLGGMDSGLVLVLRSGASPLWGIGDQMWLSQPLRAPSIHHPLVRSQLPPKFQAQARPQVTFQIVQPHSHPIPTWVPSLPLAWLSKCSSLSDAVAGSQATTASAITQNCEQMSRLLTWTVLNHYITLVLKITALAPHKILHPLLGLAPELLALLTCSSLPKRAACAS